MVRTPGLSAPPGILLQPFSARRSTCRGEWSEGDLGPVRHLQWSLQAGKRQKSKFSSRVHEVAGPQWSYFRYQRVNPTRVAPSIETRVVVAFLNRQLRHQQK